MNRPEILVIDDDADVLLALDLLLKESGYAVTADTDPRNIPALMRGRRFDAVFLDMNFRRGATDGKEGLSWLKQILKSDPEAMVIPVTAFGDVDLAVRAVKEGAADFILKPWTNEKLLSSLAMALRLRETEQRMERMREQQKILSSDLDRNFADIVGKSEAMARVFAMIRKVADTDANVLILGENGTGKELVARALHRGSGRRDGVFICVDMGSLSESLFESELFGHVRGSFTDAREARVGRFESASGGTLFLDEIGNLSLQMQAKLLRAIESSEVTPVGSNEPRKIDARLICATNMPIRDMVARKEFRQDLLYRVNTIEITLPPLRERREDIRLLVEFFSELYYRKYKIPRKRIPRATYERLEEYPWPGNVRELKHAVERAILIGDTDALFPEDFSIGDRTAHANDAVAGADGSSLKAIEKTAIRRCLEKNGGNISRSAKELGLTRAALYRRIQKHGLQELSD